MQLMRNGILATVAAIALTILTSTAFAQDYLPPPRTQGLPQQGEPQELPRPAETGEETDSRFSTIPNWSDSLRASHEALLRGERARLDATARQLGWNNEMRHRAALPPWQLYYAPGSAAASSSAGRAYGQSFDPGGLSIWGATATVDDIHAGFAAPSGSLADFLIQEQWLPTSNVDLFGYRYDNPVRQPAGMRSIQRGPDTYESRPVYAEDLTSRDASTPPASSGPRAEEIGVRDSAEELASDVPTEASMRAAGMAALAGGDFEAALQHASDWIALFDERDASANAEALFLKVHAHLGLEAFADAAIDLHAALDQTPHAKWKTLTEDYQVYYVEPAAFTRQLRRAEAAVRAVPDDYEARLMLGYLYFGLGYPALSRDQLAVVRDLADAGTAAERAAKKLLEQLPEGDAENGKPIQQIPKRDENRQPVRQGRIF